MSDKQEVATFSANPNDPAFFSDPYPVYEKMRQLGTAFHWHEYNMTCFPGFGAVNALLRDRRCGRDFSNHMSREEAGLGPIPRHLNPFYDLEANSMLELEPPAHTRLRGLVNRAFVSRKLESLSPMITKLADQLIDQFPTGKTFDLLPVFAEKIPVIVIARLLGVPTEMADQLLDWSHKMVAMYEFNRTRVVEDQAVKATEEFSSYIRSYVDRRRSTPDDDLISKLIAAEQEGSRLSNDELVSTCILLLNAGHEATVHGIGNAVGILLQSDSNTVASFHAANETYAAVDELLRFDPPLHQFTRYVLEDFSYQDVDLKRGQIIGLMLGSANRDPERFAHPDRLDFERTDGGHTSFGAGIHFCIGAPLARMEIQIALSRLLTRLPNLQLADEPMFADRYHFHGLDALNVISEE